MVLLVDLDLGKLKAYLIKLVSSYTTEGSAAEGEAQAETESRVHCSSPCREEEKGREGGETGDSVQGRREDG